MVAFRSQPRRGAFFLFFFLFREEEKMQLRIPSARVIGLSGTQQMVAIPTKNSSFIRSSYGTGTNPGTDFRLQGWP